MIGRDLPVYWVPFPLDQVLRYLVTIFSGYHILRVYFFSIVRIFRHARRGRRSGDLICIILSIRICHLVCTGETHLEVMQPTSF